MSTSSATTRNLSFASASQASTPLTPDSLNRFLIDAPSVFKDNLNSRAEKQILTNCYRALWNNNNEWMQHYFFKEGLGEQESLTLLLERHDMFSAINGSGGGESISGGLRGDKHHASSSTTILQSNPDNVIVDSTQNEPEYWETQRGKQCGHLFKKGESVYRCRNCGLDDTCVMCSRCFHATNHDGHDVKIWISRGAGGCCDCGDPEAWKVPLECRIHSLSATHDDTGRKIVRPIMEPYDSIPSGLLDSIHDTLSTVLDYILETFAASPENITPGSADDILKDTTDSHTALGIPDTTNTRHPTYACVLWNDERHSFEEVNDIVVKALKCSRSVAQKVAEHVDAYGRHILFTTENLNEAIKVALQIKSINLATTVRSTQNTLREDISGILLEWLKDLISGRFKFFTSVDGGTSILRDVMCKALCEDWALSPDLAMLSTRTRRPRRQDMADEADALDMDNYDDDDDDDDDDVGSEGSDHNDEFASFMDSLQASSDINPMIHNNDDDDDDDMEYHDADDDVEMGNSSGLTPYFNQITSPNAAIDTNNTPTERQNASTLATSPTSSSPPLLIEMTDQTPRRSLDTTQQQKKSPRDIVDFSYNLDEWLAHTAMMETSERELTESLGVPVPSHSPVELYKTNMDMRKEFKRKLRLDYLLQFDLRLWKSARSSIKDILIGTLISNFDHRPVLGTRFARNYPDLVDSFFFKDREPEHSVSSLSVQLLTVPTVAWMLVKEYKFFGMVSSILSNFFLTDSIHMLLPDKYRTMQVDCRSRSITRHRYAYTFFDLRYVLNADLVKTEVSQGPIYLRFFLDMLYQFQAMDPLERQMDTHVEYESSSWVSAFNVTLQVSKLCRLFAGCYSSHHSSSSDRATTLEASRHLCRSIYRVLHQIAKWNPQKSTAQQSVEGDSTAANNRGTQILILGTEHQSFRSISTPYSGSFDVVDYDVTVQPVSFHHPFHWLLSELLEHISLLRHDLIVDLGWPGGFKQMIQQAPFQLPQNLFLTILDYPLRTIVMLAQINCGVWVRNGYGVRNQARTYRDIHVRENTFDRDIYLLQIGLVAVNSDHLLVTMLDRFKLWDWFNGKTKKPHVDYEQGQLTFIVEEFLNLLAICATERGYASAMSVEDHIRRSIIQYLGISSMAYSELVKMVPESLSEHESFEPTLSTLATYKAPDGLNDHGLYELKDEYYGELDPYFWHFTRNHREEAMDALRKQWKKQHPDEKLDDKEEFMLVPRLVDISSGPFTHLNDFLHSRTFCQIVTHALWNTKMASTPSETILETTLYLAMLAVDTDDRTNAPGHSKGKQRAETATSIDPAADPAQNTGFIHHATTNEYAIQVNEIERGHATLLTILLRCLNDKEWKHVHKRLDYIVGKIEQQGSAEAKAAISDWRLEFDKAAVADGADPMATTTQSEYEKKKAAAKARQAAIMTQFAQAQSQFMSQHSELYDEDDDGIEDEKHRMDEDNQEVLQGGMALERNDNEAGVERLCHFPAGTCIVCQEELDRNRLYGVLGLVQHSHIQRQTPLKNADVLVDLCATAQGRNIVMENAEATTPGVNMGSHGFPSDAHVPGVQVSSCGHLMHARCFDNYRETVENETLGHLPGFPTRRRFLCPLCKALGNILLPVTWKGKTESYPGVMAPPSPYELVGERLMNAIQQLQQDYQAHGGRAGEQLPGSYYSSTATLDDSLDMNNLTHEKLLSLRDLYTQMLVTLKMAHLNYGNGRRILSLTDMDTMEMQLFDMYAYTISSIEIAQRGMEHSATKARDLTVEYTGTFLDSISIQTQTLLKILAKTNDLLPKVLRDHGDGIINIRKLAMSTLSQVLYEGVSTGVDRPAPLLCDDPFRVLTRLGFCDVLNNDGFDLDVHHLMRLLFVADITKTVIALVQGLTGSDSLEDPQVVNSIRQVMDNEASWKNNDVEATAEVTRRFAEQVMHCLQVPSSFVAKFFTQIDARVLVALVRVFTLPFLRKCLLLMVVHHGFVPQPPADDEVKPESSTTTTADDDSNKNSTVEEYDQLLSILRLPGLNRLLNLESFEQQFVVSWCHHYRSHSLDDQQTTETTAETPSDTTVATQDTTPAYARLVQLELNLPTPFSMVPLPYRMDQLFDESSRRICRNCKTVPENPALCLMCGTFVCARGYCCNNVGRGECNTHMRLCGGEIGIYMVIKECFVLLLHDNGGTVMNAPYLDAHGEVDLFLKRGAPQYLNSKRYDQLRQMWLSHSIPAFVRRRMEVSYSYQRWESW